MTTSVIFNVSMGHPLVLWFTKWEPQNPGHSQNPFRSQQFSWYQDILCLLHCVDLCNDNAKAVMGKTAGVSAQIQPVAPNSMSRHCIPKPFSCRGKKISLLKKFLDKSAKMMNLQMYHLNHFNSNDEISKPKFLKRFY